jgi:hypothetical protein
MGVRTVAEPVVPRSRATPPRPLAAHDVWAEASLANLRQIATVLAGLGVLFLAGWTGLLLAGARPVGWGQVLMIVTVAFALGMLIEGLRRFYLLRSSRRLLRAAAWHSVDAHWVGHRHARGRKLVVLYEDGVVRLWVRETNKAVMQAIEARGRVWMVAPNGRGRSAVMVEQVPEIFRARVGSW